MTAAASPGEPDAGLAGFNRLPAEAARRALAECCAAPAWAAAVAAGRPYASAGRLLAGSDAAVAALPEAELRAALAGHPRIGERPPGPGRASGWSRQEQAGVAAAGPQAAAALAAGNQAYEQRFGHIYLACADGRTAAELLALLQARLSNPPGAEWAVVRSELAKINRIRLARLLGGGR